MLFPSEAAKGVDAGPFEPTVVQIEGKRYGLLICYEGVHLRGNHTGSLAWARFAGRIAATPRGATRIFRRATGRRSTAANDREELWPRRRRDHVHCPSECFRPARGLVGSRTGLHAQLFDDWDQIDSFATQNADAVLWSATAERQWLCLSLNMTTPARARFELPHPRISASRPRRRRYPCLRNIHVAAVASPRPVSTKHPCRSRGVAATPSPE